MGLDSTWHMATWVLDGAVKKDEENWTEGKKDLSEAIAAMRQKVQSQ